MKVKARRLFLGGLSALTALSIVVPLVLMLRAVRSSPPSKADVDAQHLRRRPSKLKGAQSSSLRSPPGREGKKLETGKGKAERGAASVSCGNHRAPTCSGCGDEEYCNGDCEWEGASTDVDSDEDDGEGGGICRSRAAEETKNVPIVAEGAQASAALGEGMGSPRALMPRSDLKSQDSLDALNNGTGAGGQKEWIKDPPEGCWRRCPSGALHRNIIILDHNGAAGLNDRGFLINKMAELAGYLCARVYVPPPYTMLSSHHNAGHEISPKHVWDDFKVIKFANDGSPALITYHPPGKGLRPTFNLSALFRDDEYADWFRVTLRQKGKSKEHLAVQATRQLDQLESLTRTQIQASGSASTGFIWEVYPVYYSWSGALQSFFKKRNEMNSTSGSDLPFVSGCKYVKPHPWQSRSYQFKERVFDRIQRRYPSTTHFGYFHIRRGDAKGQCDTSFKKLASYIPCSLKGADAYGNITIVFSSDEKDPCYRSTVQSISELIGHSFVDLDATVKEVVTDYIAEDPDSRSHLMNNFFIYNIIQHCNGDQKKIPFKMVLRRKGSCPWCEDGAKAMSRRKLPILREAAVQPSINVTFLKDLYHSCKPERGAGSVSCGNHRAPTCSGCGDEEYCNGDCEWEGASADVDSDEDDGEGGGTCREDFLK